MTKLALGVTALVSLLVPACATDAPALQPTAGPSQAISCGVADDAAAARLSLQLHAKLAGQLTGDQVACARAIVDATRVYGLDEHAAQIAVATAITETSLVNASAGDTDAAGLYGQHVSEGWGLPGQLVDPTFATHAFLDRVVIDFPNDAWQAEAIGVVAETIQRAPAAEFQAQANDGAVLAHALWTSQVEAH